MSRLSPCTCSHAPLGLHTCTCYVTTQTTLFKADWILLDIFPRPFRRRLSSYSIRQPATPPGLAGVTCLGSEHHIDRCLLRQLSELVCQEKRKRRHVDSRRGRPHGLLAVAVSYRHLSDRSFFPRGGDLASRDAFLSKPGGEGGASRWLSGKCKMTRGESSANEMSWDMIPAREVPPC